MTALATVESIITDAITDIQTLQDTATGFAQTAQTAASTALTGGVSVPNPTEPDVNIPVFVDPDQDLGNEWRTERSNAQNAYDALIASELTSYLATYFPSLTSCISTVQSWLCDQITSGGSGINAAVESALSNRHRDRIRQETVLAKTTVNEEWANMGWSMPAPVLTEKSRQLEQEAVTRVSDASRDIFIKAWDSELEMTKFALTHYKDLYLDALNAVRDYLTLILRSPELATERATAYVNAKRQLWEGAAAYYRALIDDARLTLDYDRLRIDSALQNTKIGYDTLIALVTNRTQAAVSAADTIANIASSRAGALNTLAEVAHNTTAEE